MREGNGYRFAECGEKRQLLLSQKRGREVRRLSRPHVVLEKKPSTNITDGRKNFVLKREKSGCVLLKALASLRRERGRDTHLAKPERLYLRALSEGGTPSATGERAARCYTTERRLIGPRYAVVARQKRRDPTACAGPETRKIWSCNAGKKREVSIFLDSSLGEARPCTHLLRKKNWPSPFHGEGEEKDRVLRHHNLIRNGRRQTV